MILYPFFSVGHLYLGTTTAGITVSSTASATSTISGSKKKFFVILCPSYVSIVIFYWNYAGKFCKNDLDLEQHQQCTEKNVKKKSGKFTKGCVITCMNSSDKCHASDQPNNNNYCPSGLPLFASKHLTTIRIGGKFQYV